MRLSWLADVLRTTGYPVHELAGWRGRGAELERVDAVVWHHTATGRTARDETVANLLRLGRPDLAGPLAQVGLDRAGGWWIVADGRCNHNGFGTYGNQAIGIEAFHDGDPGSPWSGPQMHSWVTGTAAICARLALPSVRVVGHKETDPNRKIDPAGIPMDRMRDMVGRDITHPALEEDPMPSLVVPWEGQITAGGWAGAYPTFSTLPGLTPDTVWVVSNRGAAFDPPFTDPPRPGDGVLPDGRWARLVGPIVGRPSNISEDANGVLVLTTDAGHTYDGFARRPAQTLAVPTAVDIDALAGEAAGRAVAEVVRRLAG